MAVCSHLTKMQVTVKRALRLFAVDFPPCPGGEVDSQLPGQGDCQGREEGFLVKL